MWTRVGEVAGDLVGLAAALGREVSKWERLDDFRC